MSYQITVFYLFQSVLVNISKEILTLASLVVYVKDGIVSAFFNFEIICFCFLFCFFAPHTPVVGMVTLLSMSCFPISPARLVILALIKFMLLSTGNKDKQLATLA